MEFSQCISDSATLLKLHLWPGSPTKPKVAFHFNFMDHAEKFLLESHVSLHKFCSSVEIEYQDMLPKLVCNNYTVYVMYNKPIDLQSIESYNFYTGFFSSLRLKTFMQY